MKTIYNCKIPIPFYLFSICLTLLLLFPSIQARAGDPDSSPPKIIIDTVAVSVWDDGSGKVGAQLLLKNIGHSSAIDLKVTELKVKHGNYVEIGRAHV